MGPRVLVLSLVPPAVLEQTLRHLREWLPEARVTALVGADEFAPQCAVSRSDEILHWRYPGGRALLAEVRRRRFDLMIVAHGRDQYLSGTYWKAVALALGSDARAKLFCEEGKLSGRDLQMHDLMGTWAGIRTAAAVLMRGAARAAVQTAEEAYVAGMGVLLLAPVLVGIMLTDMTEAVSRGRPAGGARGREKDRG